MKNREPDATDRKIVIGTIAVVLIFYVLVALGSL
jgi:hypothetical protein